VDALAVVEGLKLPRGLVLTLSSSALAIALALVHFFEGVSFTAYQDVGGVWTICNGHTGNVRRGQVATQAECDAIEHDDTVAAQRVVRQLVAVPLPTSREAALTDFVVNLGAGTFAKSSVLRKLNTGDVAGACAAISLYHYVGKLDCHLASSNCPGIVTRRNVERWLCEQTL
jgi:lysozyme